MGFYKNRLELYRRYISLFTPVSTILESRIKNIND